MAYPDYKTLYRKACERKGGESAVGKMLPNSASKNHLRKLGSDRYLAEFSRKIF